MSEWIKVEDGNIQKLPLPPLGIVHLVWEREYIGQGMPKPPIRMLTMGDYQQESWYTGFVDSYGNPFDEIEEGGVTGGKITHWREQIDLPGEE